MPSHTIWGRLCITIVNNIHPGEMPELNVECCSILNVCITCLTSPTLAVLYSWLWNNPESVLLHRLLVFCQSVFSPAETLLDPSKWPFKRLQIYVFLHCSMVVSHGLHTDPTFVILNPSISAVSSAFLGWHGLIVFHTLPSLRALAVSALNA